MTVQYVSCQVSAYLYLHFPFDLPGRVSVQLQKCTSMIGYGTSLHCFCGQAFLQSSKLKFDALGQHHFSTRVSFLMQIFDPVDRLKIMPISWALPCDHFSLKICDRYTTKGSPARQLTTNHKYLCHDHC